MGSLRTALVLIFLLSGNLVAAQQNSLERQNERRRLAEKRLEEIRGLLGDNYGNILASERGLKLAGNRIAAQREIAAGLDADMERFSAKISAGARQIRGLDSTITELKKDYGRQVYSAWKNHMLNNAAAFLFASHDFNDATRRLAHIRRYNRAREMKKAQIDSLVGRLQSDTMALRISKDTLGVLKAESNAVLSSLRADEAKYRDAQKRLRSDRKKLEAQAKKERETIAAAQREIDRIIALQAKAAKGERSGADVALSGRFEENRGRLPWPVGGPGTVLDRFGVERMADGIERDSKGITIAARPGATVKAVFEGRVTGVYNIGQFDKCVTVRSGNYVVLYGNLASTEFKSGDTVALNQSVGTLGDSNNADRNMLIFQIWRETTALDPEEWLRK